MHWKSVNLCFKATLPIPSDETHFDFQSESRQVTCCVHRRVSRVTSQSGAPFLFFEWWEAAQNYRKAFREGDFKFLLSLLQRQQFLKLLDFWKR